MQPSSVSALVDCGAEVNHRDSSGLTAIHVACYHGNKRALTALLNKQASVIITDKLVSMHSSLLLLFTINLN